MERRQVSVLHEGALIACLDTAVLLLMSPAFCPPAARTAHLTARGVVREARRPCVTEAEDISRGGATITPRLTDPMAAAERAIVRRNRNRRRRSK